MNKVAKNIKVSLLIPCYNTLKYLKKCLNSCIKQTYKNIEIIACDDCSSDSTLNYLNRYKNKIKIIKNNKNLGLLNVRKKLVENCSGDIILFIDSDDFLINNNVIKELVEIYLENNMPDILAFNVKEYKNNKFEYPVSHNMILNNIKIKGIQAFLWNLKGGLAESVISKVYSKNFFTKFIKNIPFELKITFQEDYLINYVLFQKAKNIVLNKFYGYAYRIRDDSSSNFLNSSKEKFEKTLREYKKVRKWINKNPINLTKEWKKTFTKNEIKYLLIYKEIRMYSWLKHPHKEILNNFKDLWIDCFPRLGPYDFINQNIKNMHSNKILVILSYKEFKNLCNYKYKFENYKFLNFLIIYSSINQKKIVEQIAVHEKNIFYFIPDNNLFCIKNWHNEFINIISMHEYVHIGGGNKFNSKKWTKTKEKNKNFFIWTRKFF